MKKLFFALFIVSTKALANPALTADFKSYVKSGKVGAVAEQAYCYSDNGQVQGYQTLKMQRVASVTKLLTTYLASETLDLHQRFRTRIFIGKDSLHIQGSQDPYFEEDKFLILLKSLNDLGYKSFKKITFDKNFHFYDLALEEYIKVTPLQMKARMEAYLKRGNSKFINAQWSVVKKFAFEEGVILDNEAPSLYADVISLSDTNPLLQENPAVYDHMSLPLHSLIKTMNVQSKNYVAENIYSKASSVKTFSALMKELGIQATTFKIYNGSGLPVIGKESRLDNLATCDVILKIIQRLSVSIQKHKLELSDIVAVNGGLDLGSFRNRFEEYPETHGAVLSKTGTLKHTSSLAGFLITDRVIPFAILNHTASPALARKFQDKFVARMFHHLGNPEPLIYTKLPIFPWDGSEFLKPVR